MLELNQPYIDIPLVCWQFVETNWTEYRKGWCIHIKILCESEIMHVPIIKANERTSSK